MRTLSLVIALTLAPPAAHGAALVEIPTQNGVGFETIWDISGDGRVLAGTCIDAAADRRPCRWSAASGYVVLEEPAGSPPATGPLALTRDGASAYGALGDATPARWNAAGQAEVLSGVPPGSWAFVWDVSADGSVAVGLHEGRAFRWTAPGTFELAPDGRAATAVSADGSVAVACCIQSGPPDRPVSRAFLWRANGEIREIPRLHRRGEDPASGISGDGRYVLLAPDAIYGGWGFAYRWSAHAGTELVKRPTEQAFRPRPFGASTDGALIVGTDDEYWGESFVWDKPHGARTLAAVLTEKGGSLGPWTRLAQTLAVSEDGLRVPAIATRDDGTWAPVIAVLAPACSDGVDNDGDALADAADPECSGPADDSEALATSMIPGLGGAGLALALIPLALVRRRAFAFALAIAIVPAAAGAAGIVAIEPQGGVHFAALAISGDGQVIAGTCGNGTAAPRPCRWRIASGPEYLAGTWTSDGMSQIGAMSYDGSIVVGARADGPTRRPVRWLANGDREDLAGPSETTYGSATHVSPDGSVIAGSRWGGGAFRWTADTGMEVVPQATLVGGTDVFFRRDASGAFDLLRLGQAPIPLPQFEGSAPFWPSANTPDGSLVLSSPERFVPTIPLWRESTGALERLGPSTYPFFLHPFPAAISADGATIVGDDEVAGPFVWRSDTGLLRLRDYLVANGIGAPGWEFDEMGPLSPDGRFAIVRGWRNGGYAEALVNLAPACSDGLDNDGDGAVDLADPRCTAPGGRTERPGCGLGFEIALVLGPIALARRRMRPRR